jgi:hypothetical protein
MLRRVSSEETATAEIKRLRGSISDGFDLLLDFWDEDGKTVWCWKDDRTRGASQTFTSKRKAEDAMRNDQLIFAPARRAVARRDLRVSWVVAVI